MDNAQQLANKHIKDEPGDADDYFRPCDMVNKHMVFCNAATKLLNSTNGTSSSIVAYNRTSLPCAHFVELYITQCMTDSKYINRTSVLQQKKANGVNV
jgi:hypothetical protein